MTVINADCRDAMRAMDADSVDAIVSDPPYGLSFMGKGWDRGVPGVDFWTEALRVVKPGAYMLAFGGARTFHRLACAIEDAGWEIQDCLSWLYGSGFPKHKSKLKPAWEPIILARRPAPRATLLNLDACRPDSGRWPANVALDEEAAAAMDEQSGECGSFLPAGRLYDGGDKTRNVYGKFAHTQTFSYGDSGGASRFFYCAKASRSEREAGLVGMPAKQRPGAFDDDAYEWKQPGGHVRARPARNHHPTVKPVALMRWLVRLITPTDGLVLDPFTGSGTTGVAAVLEGRRFVGCELSAEYAAIARARIAHAEAQAEPELDIA